MSLREIHYRVASPASGLRPGAHRSRSGDTGFEFRGHAPLQDAPDPRRLDLHASLRDPFGQWIVRQYAQRKSIPVAVVADVSASMGFEGTQRKLDVLADFTASLAWSVARHGDSFGFVACDDRVQPGLTLPQTRQRAAGVALAARLRSLEPTGRSAAALCQAHRHLPRQRALVFLVSDFHLPLDDVAQVLDSLSGHELVPMVLWQAVEFALPSARGLAQVVDPESGRRQWLWWRPALRERWRQAHADRRAALEGLFHARRLSPLFLHGAFDADAVTRHFVA